MNYWIISAIIIIILLAAAVSVLLTRRYIRTFTDKRIAEYQNDLITKHCEEVQNIYKTMRGWRHDYKNHIQVMRASLEMGSLDELKSYLGELSVDLDTVETVVLLSQRRPDTHIDIKLDLSEFDITAAETKATYQEIKDYVLEKYGLKVSTLYISQVKAKCGIIERECYNKGEGKSRVPQCPKEKESAIMDALRHFRMV